MHSMSKLSKHNVHYYSANEEWQSRDILFTIAEYIVQWYPYNINLCNSR